MSNSFAHLNPSFFLYLFPILGKPAQIQSDWLETMSFAPDSQIEFWSLTISFRFLVLHHSIVTLAAC